LGQFVEVKDAEQSDAEKMPMDNRIAGQTSEKSGDF
jgi:hypothetical protein